MAYVLLLHFDQVLSTVNNARHYLEYAEVIERRLQDHRSGDRTRTSGIMYACYERNIKFVVARIWVDATRRNEYQLRQLHNNPKLCPICNPALALYTPYLPNDPKTWQTIRLQPDVLTARYGDLETLKPYVYKPKHRTRRNGEHNRTSGNASTWRADTKAAIKERLAPLALPGMQEFIDSLSDDYLNIYRDSANYAPGDYDANGVPSIQIVDDAGTQLVDQAALERWVDRVLPGLIGGTVHIDAPRVLRQVQPPIDNDHAPTGFDADIPY